MYRKYYLGIRTFRSICVLNTENRLNVELQFELLGFGRSVFVFYQQITILYILFGLLFVEGNKITLVVIYGCET